MGKILCSAEEDGNIPIEFSNSQNVTSRTEILCCLTARESQVGVKYQQRNGREDAVKWTRFIYVNERL